MATRHPVPSRLESDLLSASWEARRFMADSVFDRSYERTNEALRRWLDGMEAALAAPKTHEVLR